MASRVPIFRGLGAVLYKETIHLRRDPVTLVVMFLIPAIQLLIFGYTIEMQVRDVPTVVWDRDHSDESRLFAMRVQATGTIALIDDPTIVDFESLEAAMRDGRANVAVEIPPDFSANLHAGKRADVLVLIDGSDSNKATQAMAAINSVALAWNNAILVRHANHHGVPIPQIDPRPITRYNPDMESANFFVPGLVGIILQIVTVFLTAASIVRERERGTLEQLLVTPVTRGAIILGKLLPYAVIGFVETILVLAIMVTIFAVPIAGDVGLLLALSVCFLFPALGLGIMISTVARNTVQAMFGAMLIMLPSILLSGFVFPRESMPTPMFLLGYLIPVTYYLEILRGIVLRGAGITELFDEAVILLAFGAVLLTVASARFKKRLG